MYRYLIAIDYQAKCDIPRRDIMDKIIANVRKGKSCVDDSSSYKGYFIRGGRPIILSPPPNL